MKLTATSDAAAFASRQFRLQTLASKTGEDTAALMMVYATCESEPLQIDGMLFWPLSYRAADTNAAAIIRGYKIWNYMAEDGEVLTVSGSSAKSQDELHQKIRAAYESVAAFRRALQEPLARLSLEQIGMAHIAKNPARISVQVRLRVGSDSRDFLLDVMGPQYEDVQASDEFEYLIDPKPHDFFLRFTNRATDDENAKYGYSHYDKSNTDLLDVVEVHLLKE